MSSLSSSSSDILARGCEVNDVDAVDITSLLESLQVDDDDGSDNDSTIVARSSLSSSVPSHAADVVALSSSSSSSSSPPLLPFRALSDKYDVAMMKYFEQWRINHVDSYSLLNSAMRESTLRRPKGSVFFLHPDGKWNEGKFARRASWTNVDESVLALIEQSLLHRDPSKQIDVIMHMSASADGSTRDGDILHVKLFPRIEHTIHSLLVIPAPSPPLLCPYKTVKKGEYLTVWMRTFMHTAVVKMTSRMAELHRDRIHHGRSSTSFHHYFILEANGHVKEGINCATQQNGPDLTAALAKAAECDDMKAFIFCLNDIGDDMSTMVQTRLSTEDDNEKFNKQSRQSAADNKNNNNKRKKNATI